MNPQGAFIFLISTLLTLAAFLFLTRFLLQLVKADFYNPISQTVMRFTNPLLSPLRKILPSSQQIDWASLVLLVAVVLLKGFFIATLKNIQLDALSLSVFVVYTLAGTLLNYFFWAILIEVLMSWVLPDPRNPFVQIVTQITEPIMAPARKIIPPIGGLDLSPILVLFIIQFLLRLIGM